MEPASTQTRPWLQKAAQARSMIETSSGHGAKLAAEQAAAERLGIRWSSLRAYLEAAQVVDRLSKVSIDAAKVLRNRPVDVVRSIGRWSRFDLPGAITFILEHPSAPTGAVLASERRAREKRSKAIEHDIATTLESAWERLDHRHYHYRLHPVVTEHLRMLDHTFTELAWTEVLPLDHRSPQEEYAKALGIEKIGHVSIDRMTSIVYSPTEAEDRIIIEAQYAHSPYWHPEHGLAACCFLQLSRFGVIESYRREAKSLQMRALLAAELYPLVVLPVPSQAARSELLAGLVSTPQHFWTDKSPGRPSAPSEESPLPDHVLDAPPHILLPGRFRGAIIVTTPQTVIEDLFIHNFERYQRERDERRAIEGRK